MTWLLIDGNSIVNRAFYGIRPLTTKDGRFTNALVGFFNIYLRLREMTSPDRGIVCGVGMGHDGNTRPDLLRPLSEWLRAP